MRDRHGATPLIVQFDARVPQRIFFNAQTFLALVVLAVPFVAAVVALHGLSDHIATFHGSDEEIYHYPLIVKFIATFPRMDLSDYDSATTPLFHVLFATIGKLGGSDLRLLRSANVLATYCSAVVLFALFRQEIMTGWLTSLLVALMLVLSPYVFGVSFLLLTDNLAMLFAVGTMFCTLRYMRTGQWNAIALAALLASCAILTRQFYLWLLITMLTAGAVRKYEWPAEQGLSGISVLVVLAIAPFAVLCVLWGGLTPPAARQYYVTSALMGPLAFFTACVGVYSAPFLALSAWQGPWIGHQTKSVALLAIMVLVISALLLRFGQLHYVRTATDCSGAATCFVTDGYLWRLSLLFPSVGQTSLMFYILVPLGLVALICTPWNKIGIFAITIYMSFGFFALGQTSLYQKYYEVPALLVCCLIFTKLGNERSVQAILACYCIGFIAYAVVRQLTPLA
jgi:hypothetical protein